MAATLDALARVFQSKLAQTERVQNPNQLWRIFSEALLQAFNEQLSLDDLQTTRRISAGGSATLSDIDQLVLVSLPGASSVTLTLPEATDGRRITVKDAAGTAGTSTITLQTTQVEGVAGATTISGAFGIERLIWDASAGQWLRL